jgi:HEXXH motif-containing protein
MSDHPTPPHGLLLLPGPDDARLSSTLRKLGLLVLRALLTPPALALPAPLEAALRRLRPWLEVEARRRRVALLAALGSPDVLAPMLSALAGRSRLEQALEQAVPQLLAQLGLDAASGEPAEALLWDRPFVRLVDPLRGEAHELSAPAQGLRVDRGSVELRLADGTLRDLRGTAGASAGLGRRALFDLHGLPGVFATVDTNPHALDELHPEKHGNAIDLGGRAVEDWRAALDAALELIAQALPGLRAELALSLRRLVPVGFYPEVHLSASYREAPGLVYVSLHPSPLTLAEALIHETQHAKLNALNWLDPVLHNGRTDWAPSPVRPDLRPLMGVLMAVHAFVPVAALHRQLAEQGAPAAQSPEFELRRAQVLQGNHAGLHTLVERGQPTGLGAELLADLQALHDWARDGRELSTDPARVRELPG